MTRKHYERIIGGVLLMGIMVAIFEPRLFEVGVSMWLRFMGG